MGLRDRHGADGGTNGGIDVRHRSNAFKQRAQVKPRATNQNGQASFRMRLVDLLARFGRPARSSTGLRPVNMAEKAVWDVPHFLPARARGKNLKIGIYLAGVCIDDRSIGRLSQSKRQRALAAGGRPGNKRDAGARFAHRCFRSVHVRRNLSGKCGLESAGY